MRCAPRLCLSLLLIGGFVLPAAAAPPMHFSRVGGDAGLSQGGVMAVVQDMQGFLWLGTEDGLDRYDGYEVRHFVHERNRPGSLPNSWVSALAEDAAGTLWIGTDGGGVVGLDPATGRFDNPAVINNQAVIGSEEKIRVLRIDREGRLWVGTRDGGVVMIDRAHSTVRRFRHRADDASSLSSDSIFALLEDRSGSIWVGSQIGLDRLDPTSGRVDRQTALLAQLVTGKTPQVQVVSLLEDVAGNLWVGTNAGLVRRDSGSDAIAVYGNRADDAGSLPANRVQAMLQDSEQRLWIGTAAGLALYDPLGNRFQTYRNDPADTETLPDDNVVSLYEDRGGLMWVGTKSGGLAKWNPRSWSFGHHKGGIADGLSEGNITAFAEDADHVWIGSFGGGLDAIDRHTGIARHYRHRASDPQSLPDDQVMALLLDHDGVLWVGTMSAGLSRLDQRTGRFTTYRHDPTNPSSLAAPGVMSLLEDSSGRIWVGTFGGGATLLDRASATFKRYPNERSNAAIVSSDRATALAEDRSGRIWIGTDGGGLCLLDPARGRLTRFVYSAGKAHALSANTVYSVHVDERGQVWIGTRGGGLDLVQGSALAPEGITFRNYSESDGLTNTTIYGIEGDSNGRLWLSSNRGLTRFDPQTGEFHNFRRAHGLQGDEFNFGAHYRSPEGKLFFGGPHGYNEFFAERLRFNDHPPAVVLTSLLKLNAPARTATPYERLRSVELGYKDDIVTFEFAALDYASPEDNRYSYMLDGFDTNWVDAAAKRQVTYTNLAPGKYTFRVRAANNDGKWNQAGLQLPLEVGRAPWATPWARAGYAIVCGLLLLAVWNNQQQKRRRELLYAQRLEQEVRDRTGELAERYEELERVNRQLKEASVTDPLTGLGNRRYLREAMSAIVAPEGSILQPQPAMALLVIDLDCLKPINDTYGHEAGDQVLRQIADILQRSCRSQDFIVRWGGDEFVVVQRDADLSAAEVLAERIRSQVAKQIFRLTDGKVARASCSIGFSRYPFIHEAPEKFTWEQCLVIADAALYHAKQQRNGWVGWAGTAGAAEIPSILGMLEQDLDALECDGRLEVRRARFRPEDTVDNLRVRGQQRT